MNPKLHKSNDRVFGGVYGGIAEYLEWDKRMLRILTVAAVLFIGFPVLVYVVLCFAMPGDPHNPFDLNDYRYQ